MKLLHPFVVTSVNCGPDLSVLEPEVREIFSKSELLKDPKHTNVYGFVLDRQGQLVHQFHGLPGTGGTLARSEYQVELAKAIAKLKLPDEMMTKKRPEQFALPDLPKTASGLPAGVRLFLREETRKLPVVEVVPMTADQWRTFALPSQAKEVEAEVLKDWLVWLYPAAIRAADENKRFQHFSGTLKLEPAGADQNGRYALLRGAIRLAKGNDNESTFEGSLQVVLTYPQDEPVVKSVRGIVEGDYLYRTRGTQRMPMKVAIESRPE